MLALLGAGLLAAPILNATATVPSILNATDGPKIQSNWISISTDNDHVGCKKKPGEGEKVMYLPAKPGLCIGIPGDDGDPMWVKIYLSTSGIQIVIHYDPSCTNEVTRLPVLEFGGCFKEDDSGYGSTVDVVQYLPTPQPGRFLEKRCYIEGDVHNPPQCGCQAPVFFLQSTTCAHEIDFYPESTGDSGKRDMEVDCDDGVDGYSAFQFKTYASKDATCEGDPSIISDPVTKAGCTRPPPTAGGGARPFVSKAMWCGAGCATYKYSRKKWPLCDDPKSGGEHAIDLTKVFGPNCHSTDPAPAAGDCCFAPLGYDGGPSVGTSCDEVCAKKFHRHGAAQQYCVGSEDKSAGNCFCGPSVVITCGSPLGTCTG